MRRVAGLLLAGMLAFPAAPASAGDPAGTCGGFSPVVPNCATVGTLTDFTPTLVIDVGGIFTGHVSVSIRTSTGGFAADCHYLAGQLAGCTQGADGFMLPGQPYSMTGQTGLALLGPDLRGAAVGRWEIRLEQN